MIIKENSRPYNEELNSPRKVHKCITALFDAMVPEEDREKEHLFSIGLTQKNAVKYIEVVSIGTMTSSVVHPREVFRQAIVKGAASIILAHNHPSGDTEPSQQDIDITKRIKKAGEVVGINLLDHVIIGDSYTSIFESNPFIRSI